MQEDGKLRVQPGEFGKILSQNWKKKKKKAGEGSKFLKKQPCAEVKYITLQGQEEEPQNDTCVVLQIINPET